VAAFCRGRLSVSGDLELALRLDSMFRPGPATTRATRTLRTEVRGHGLESFVVGHGTPVVLLHGLGASKASFVPTIDGLGDEFEVHALDLPGFGRSDRPLPAGRRYHARWMGDVVHGYLRAHGLRQAYVVGNSLGGRIATELALRHPRRVAGIVGLGPAVAFDEWQRLGPLLRRLQGHWLGLAPLPVRRSWVESGLAELFADPSRVPAEHLAAAVDQVLRDLRDRRFRLAVAACARQIAAEPATGRRSFWARLERLGVPSYWVWGARDRLSPPRYAERVAHHVPGARVEVWPDTGHVPQYEHPERTTAAIRGFISDLDARGRPAPERGRPDG
jgi:pimeloyl-ACP methyl ester carboxylesterase